VRAILSTDVITTRSALEDFDEYSKETLEDTTRITSANLKQYGNCWIVAVWLGMGQHYPNIDKLLTEVSEKLSSSQNGLLSTTKAIVRRVGHGFFAGMRNRGIFLPRVPPKNLVEKLNTNLRFQDLIASVKPNYYSRSQSQNLDELAVDLKK
jgi:hypothetical protein